MSYFSQNAREKRDIAINLYHSLKKLRLINKINKSGIYVYRLLVLNLKSNVTSRFCITLNHLVWGEFIFNIWKVVDEEIVKHEIFLTKIINHPLLHHHFKLTIMEDSLFKCIFMRDRVLFIIK